MNRMTGCKLTAVAALLVAAACSGPSGPPTRGPAFAGPSSVRSGSLSFMVYTAGETPGFLSTAVALDLAPDGAGNMWFTDSGTPAIGRITPDGTVTEFTSGLPQGAHPYSIVAGSKGNMWFSDRSGVTIGKVTPKGVITEYSTAEYSNSKAAGIAMSPNGELSIEGLGSQPLLASLTTQDTFTVQLLPKRMTPNGALLSDADGDLFFLAQNPKTYGEIVEQPANSGPLIRAPLNMIAAFLPCCPNVAPKSMAIGPDGDPWFTTLGFVHGSSSANYLGTLRFGKVRLMRVTNKGLSYEAYPSGLAASAAGLFMTGGDPFRDDGALWYVDQSGKMTAYKLPHNPLAVTVDGFGNPWFTAIFSGQPSRIIEVGGAR